MKTKKIASRFSLGILALVSLAALQLSPAAYADPVKTVTFACTKCTGKVNETVALNKITKADGTAGNITDQNNLFNGKQFDFTFDTAAKTVSLSGNGINMIGTIANPVFTVGQQTDDANFVANWNVGTLPPAVKGALGWKNGMNVTSPSVQVLWDHGGGNVQSVNLDMVAQNPESASLLLFGSGVAGLGTYLRRRLIRRS